MLACSRGLHRQSLRVRLQGHNWIRKLRAVYYVGSQGSELPKGRTRCIKRTVQQRIEVHRRVIHRSGNAASERVATRWGSGARWSHRPAAEVAGWRQAAEIMCNQPGGCYYHSHLSPSPSLNWGPCAPAVPKLCLPCSNSQNRNTQAPFALDPHASWSCVPFSPTGCLCGFMHAIFHPKLCRGGLLSTAPTAAPQARRLGECPAARCGKPNCAGL